MDNETEEPSELDVDDIVHDMTLNEWKVVEATQIIKRFVEKISSRVTTKQKNVSHGVVKKELNKVQMGLSYLLCIENAKYRLFSNRFWRFSLQRK